MDQSRPGGERKDFNAGVFDASEDVQGNVPESATDSAAWERESGMGANNDSFRNIGETTVGLGSMLPVPEAANNLENQVDISGEQVGEGHDISTEQIRSAEDTDATEIQSENGINRNDEQIKALSLTGEMIDKEAEKELKKKIDEYKKSPYELENYRDEAMVKSLKSSFGRIYGKNQGDGQNTNIIQFGANQGGRKAA